MLRALQTAATGMEAMQANVNTVANNLANVNTTGYKSDTAGFQDLFYETIAEPGRVVGDSQAPTGVQVGSGVKLPLFTKISPQGSARLTNNPLDLMINGDGFFAVLKEDGQINYTRDGSFKVNAQGQVVTSSGYLMQPPITIPNNSVGINISPGGEVSSRDSAGALTVIGQIEVVNFVNPAGLRAQGGNLMAVSEASGAPTQGKPGTNGLGSLEAGHLEGSNVNAVNEMVNMIQAQRAYEMNSKVIQAADQMLQVSSNVIK